MSLAPESLKTQNQLLLVACTSDLDKKRKCEGELLAAVGTRGTEAFLFSVGEGMSLVIGSQQAQE